MDELSHLPAGYSYLTQKDMRINPEHPPLIKELAGLPLLFIKGINFPSRIDAWQKDVNGQWNYGFYFLYRNGNPADQMIFWGRLPMLLVLLLGGIYVFKWAKELFGNKAGLVALFLYSFSPTLIAHGRLVTTDVGAAAGILIATYYFVKFLKERTAKSMVIAGLALGFAELAKFSAILLLPFFGIIVIIWAIVKTPSPRSFLKTFVPLAASFIAIIAIAYILLFPFYQYLVINYPPEKQVSDSAYLLSSFKYRLPADIVVWMADKPVLRAYAQYALGLLMVSQRATGGNTTYFMGEVSASGWKTYFPLVYLAKEPLAFHLLTLTALVFCLWSIIKKRLAVLKTGLNQIADHPAEFAMLLFIALYWLTSISSPLNIGVRHLMPIFPLTIILVAGCIAKILNPPFVKAKYAILAALLLWQAAAIAAIYPHFLAYFNEIAGGPDNGYIYTVDSNLDWGQDLKRLVTWTEENNVNTIYVDYFGGSDAAYYLKDKFQPWWGTRNPHELPKGSYLAVSGTFLQGGRGTPVPGFTQNWGHYLWLNKYQPVAKIGYSIFVYKID